jgi:DNA-binding NtrC family response regulator
MLLGPIIERDCCALSRAIDVLCRMPTIAPGLMAHLLLVDDDDAIVEALGEMLRQEGHVVRSASTGEEGLRALRASPLPDAVVLDVDMPVLSGPGMAHKMLLHDAGEEKIPIILMSGRDDLPEIAQRMGTSYALRKPATIDAFQELLDRALSERRAPSSA